MARRLTPELPSPPSSQSASTSCRAPSGASRTARAASAPSVTAATRQPIMVVTLGSSATASRSTCSTSGCGACWPGSAYSSCGVVVSPKAPGKRVISWPNSPVQKTTSCAWSTGSGAAARSRSASPQRRRCSMVRTLVVLARGRSGSSDVRGSTTRTGMPRRPSSMAALRPLGPPPAISTGTCVGTVVIGSPVLGDVRVLRPEAGSVRRSAGRSGSSALHEHPWPGSRPGPPMSLSGRPDGGVLELPDPGAAVVVAVRGAQHGVDVEGLGGVVVEEDAAVVVQLRDQHRGLDAVVEDVAGLGATDPAEPRLGQVLADLPEPGGARTGR